MDSNTPERQEGSSMHNGHHSANPARERIKLALIPILALILGAVLFWPGDEDSTALPQAELASPEEMAKLSPGKKAGALNPIASWPEVNLERAIAVSPFDPLAFDAAQSAAGAAANSAAETNDAAPQEGESKPSLKVDVIYEAGGQLVAVVEGRIVREGDALAGGRVVKITPAELVLERESPAP
jgi:hypothetical protein